MHTAYFFNSRDGDRIYNADSFGEWLKPFFTNGVFNGDFAVTANDNMTVTVSGGKGFINGKSVTYTSEAFDLEVASGTLNRIDSVVLRRDDTLRDIYLVVLTGGNANTPIAPALSRDNGLYDLKLCDIYIAKGTIKVKQENITDTRQNNSVCGFVVTTIDHVDTSTLYLQYLDWYNNFTSLKRNEMTEWQQEQSEAFQAWYNEHTEEWDLVAKNRLDETMEAIDSVITNNGPWDSNKEKYLRYSVVTYPVNGKTRGFIAIKEVLKGIPPTNINYWAPFTYEGERGGDAVITEISTHYAFQIRDGHLHVMFPDNTEAPPFKIREDGHLIYRIE